MSTDCESHSANFSLTSTITPTLRHSSSLCFIFSCLADCCHSSDQSLKAQNGSSVSPRDISISTLKTADILTMPALQEQCHNPHIQIGVDHHSARMTSSSIAATKVTHSEPVSVRISDVGQQTEGPRVKDEDANSENIYLNDLDLLCSIADTYDLGADTEAFSYVSNCLHNVRSRSLQRTTFDRSNSSRKSATLGSDQLYPEAMSGFNDCRSKGKKEKRRQSLATIANVYMNEKGNPLIL